MNVICFHIIIQTCLVLIEISDDNIKIVHIKNIEGKKESEGYRLGGRRWKRRRE